jgi:hypothetical protein
MASQQRISAIILARTRQYSGAHAAGKLPARCRREPTTMTAPAGATVSPGWYEG